VTTEIQQNRYDRLLRRVAGIIGPGSKVSEVLAELFPMIDVENVPSELLILMGTNTAFGGGSIQGAAGENPKLGLFNPAGSNTIITITDVYMNQSTTNATVRWGLNVNQLANQITTQQFTDTRRAIANLPVGQVGTESAVAFAPGTGQLRLDADQLLHLEGKNDVAMLRPGMGFVIGTAFLTSTQFTTFYWRERTMEASEVLSGG